MALPTELVAAILVFLDPDHVLKLRLVSRTFDAVILDPVFAKKAMFRHFGYNVEPQAVLRHGPFFYWPGVFQEAYSMLYLVNDEYLEAQVSSAKPITLSPCFGSLTNLQFIQCNNCGFSGSIPVEWSSLASLTVLSLSNNKLDTIPDEFGNLSNLQRLFLSNNLIDRIPSTFNQLRNLTSLYLIDNKLTHLDPVICTLPRLFILSLSRNQISSTIPETLTAMPMLTTLDLSHNNLTGPIPTTWTCNLLSDLNLSHNNLTSQIPSSLCTLPRLHTLNLSYNMLTGPIPETWPSPHITTLNLSHNALTHTIPASLARIFFLKELDLSENELTGEVPEGFSGSRCLVWVDGNYLRGLGRAGTPLRRRMGRFGKRVGSRVFNRVIVLEGDGTSNSEGVGSEGGSEGRVRGSGLSEVVGGDNEGESENDDEDEEEYDENEDDDEDDDEEEEEEEEESETNVEL
ncbi:hypothetical protein HDU79_008352 [Rhizoclosmatium sp. JEL0117]|nr:hypothetical protein HDU79_008352 [Rhizoclosmatium sp. JEL0117]